MPCGRIDQLVLNVLFLRPQGASIDWIETRPPIAYADVDHLIEAIEGSSVSFIDGVVLATALKFAYWLGLKKAEILPLRVENICDQNGSILNALRIAHPSGQITIPIPNDFKPVIVDYLLHLQEISGGSGISPTDWLFPDQNGKPYDDSSFSRHLSDFAKGLNIKVNLEKVRQAGVCKFYDDLKANQETTSMSAYGALSRTADFARRKIRHTGELLRGQIRQWGGRPKLTGEAGEKNTYR